MASVGQVSDVAHGPFVLIDYTFFFYIKAYPIAFEQGFPQSELILVPNLTQLKKMKVYFFFKCVATE